MLNKIFVSYKKVLIIMNNEWLLKYVFLYILVSLVILYKIIM